MPVRVLLADDNALFRRSLARLLRKMPDIEVAEQAADGKEAIELAKKIRPDVILIDVRMPGINGIEATRIIHGDCPEIRIIGFSMHESQAVLRAMADAGAVNYLTKEGSIAELVAAIRGCLQPHKPTVGMDSIAM